MQVAKVAQWDFRDAEVLEARRVYMEEGRNVILNGEFQPLEGTWHADSVQEFGRKGKVQRFENGAAGEEHIQVIHIRITHVDLKRLQWR